MSLSLENKALIERVLGVDAEDALRNDLFTTEEVVRLLDAARSEGSKPVPGWRPIETAEPKDGKSIIVATSDTPPVVGEAWWQTNYEDQLELWWANTSSGDYYADPISQSNAPVTHWMPLPEPPDAAAPPPPEGSNPAALFSGVGGEKDLGPPGERYADAGTPAPRSPQDQHSDGGCG